MADCRAQAEWFGRLKGVLLPLGRPREMERFAEALRACARGLRLLDMTTVLDDRVRSLIGTLDDATNTRGALTQPGSTVWTFKASQMSAVERTTFARSVDELADWLALQPKPATSAEVAVSLLGNIAGEIAWATFAGDDE